MSFSVAVDRGLLLPDGTSSYPLDALDEAGEVSWRWIDERTDEFTAAQLEGFDAVLVGGATVTDATIGGENPPLLVARMGAGFDTVAVESCTERGILVTTAPDGVQRAMASSGILLTLALAHRLTTKVARARQGHFDRTQIGHGLVERTLGVIGMGSIGGRVCELAAPFPWRRIGHDPYAAAPAGVESVALETLLREADYVVVTVPLSDETHHLINAQRLELMAPTSFLINIARGPIVDQAALTDALTAGQIAGAALDVFETEPLALDDPLMALDNVILTNHDVGLTTDMTGDTMRSACGSVIEVARGRVPARLLNPDVLAHPRVAGLARA